MDIFQQKILKALATWEAKMMRRPGLWDRMTRSTQQKMNKIIPEKIHQLLTRIIREMIKAVLNGAKYTTRKPLTGVDLRTKEEKIKKIVTTYKNTASVEGGIVGAGGFVAGLADFPLLISIKMKMLYEIAAAYGFDLNDFKERIFLLHVFELAFSSAAHRNEVFQKIKNWDTYQLEISDHLNDFDWRKFQQEYRDYIDLAKLLQMVPLIGAPVGFVVNRNLTNKLAKTAQNAYRMRIMYDRQRLIDNGLHLPPGKNKL